MNNASLKLTEDAFEGETEAYEYGEKYYPEFSYENRTRFINQCMKIYLLLIYRHQLSHSSFEVKKVWGYIEKLARQRISWKSKIFYCIVKLDDRIAWNVYNSCKLT